MTEPKNDNFPSAFAPICSPETRRAYAIMFRSLSIFPFLEKRVGDGEALSIIWKLWAEKYIEIYEAAGVYTFAFTEKGKYHEAVIMQGRQRG